MTKDLDISNPKKKDLEEFNNYCEECKKEDESVSQNLILIGLKIVSLVEFQKLFFLFSLLHHLVKCLFDSLQKILKEKQL